MTSTPGAWIVVAVALIALVPGTADALQDEIAYFGEGVLFYVAHGRPSSSHLALGPAYNGTDVLPINACGWVLARPEKNGGQVHLVGFLDGLSQLEINFENFTLDKEGTDGGLAYNVTVDGAIDHDGLPQFPRVPARIAGWGEANLFVDGDAYTDPAGTKDDYDYQASFFVTPTGFRDNATGRILAKNGEIWSPGKSAVLHPGQYEMHLRLESKNSGRGTSDVTVFRAAGDLPDGTIIRQEEHQALYRVRDSRFGGVAAIDVTATTSAPDAFVNDLRFRVISPAEKVVANLTVRPRLNQPGTAHAEFPLIMFQNYTIEATGQIALGSYQVTVTQRPPERLDFNAWWNDLAFGTPAVPEEDACEDQMGADLAVTPGLGPPPTPPAFPLRLVILGIVGTIVAGLFAIKLASDQWSGFAFLQTYRRR